MATNIQIDGAWTLQQTNTSFHGRQHDLAMLVAGASGDPTVARSGVIPRVSTAGVCQDLLVKQRSDVGSLKVDVLPGAAVVNRTSQGPYLVYNSTTRQPVLTASNPTQTRIDLIVLHAYDIALGDSNPNSAGTYAAYVEVVTGTPGSGAPSVPVNCLLLAQCSVPANAANSNQVTVTPMRVSTGLNGGTRWMLESDISTPPTAFLDSEQRWVEGPGGNSGTLDLWVGGGWQTGLSMGAYTSYTPTWVMSNTGSGAKTGRYWVSGKTVRVQVNHAAAGSVGLGTGNITFTVPFNSANVTNGFWTGRAFVNSGGGTLHMLPCSLSANTNVATLWAYYLPAIGQLDTPGNQGLTYVAGGYMSAWLEYERA